VQVGGALDGVEQGLARRASVAVAHVFLVKM
jgi:hypothetical protein